MSTPVIVRGFARAALTKLVIPTAAKNALKRNHKLSSAVRSTAAMPATSRRKVSIERAKSRSWFDEARKESSRRRWRKTSDALTRAVIQGSKSKVIGEAG